MELIEKKEEKETKGISINWSKIYKVVLYIIIALAIIMLGAAVWFCLGEAFPGLRQQMPNFFNFVDKILTGFDNLYKLSPF